MGKSLGRWVYDDNFSAHFSGVIDGRLCPAARDFPADSQKNVRMVDHEFIALHHTFFVVVSADIKIALNGQLLWSFTNVFPHLWHTRKRKFALMCDQHVSSFNV